MNPNQQSDPSKTSLPQPTPASVPSDSQQPEVQQSAAAGLLSRFGLGGQTEESQWVAAAKNIIATTQDDPYEQTEQLYTLRTEFMQQVHSHSLKQKDEDA